MEQHLVLSLALEIGGQGTERFVGLELSILKRLLMGQLGLGSIYMRLLFLDLAMKLE
jgi:hypothetical protein